MRNQKKNINIECTNRMRRMVLLFVVLVLLCGCTRKEELLLLKEEDGVEEILSGDIEDADEIEVDAESIQKERPDEVTAVSGENGLIYVHVCGAVVHPGVYELKSGSRVYEAVQEAGGFAESAEKNYVNQAQVLADGVKLVIPTVEEAAAAREEEPFAAAVAEGAERQIGIVAEEVSEKTGEEDPVKSGDGRININTASKAQLCGIPGIGETRAAAIAAYRDAHGGFEKPEDIMQVSGIKEGMYEKIKDSICVN